MTSESTARALRRQITDIYLADEPPPGAERASALTTALVREPHDAERHRQARDFLAAVDLYARLCAARDAAVAAGDAERGLVLHGLIGHATAALLGGTYAIGWRAAALDLLEPGPGPRRPLGHDDAVRLLALALGPAEANDAGA